MTDTSSQNMQQANGLSASHGKVLFFFYRLIWTNCDASHQKWAVNQANLTAHPIYIDSLCANLLVSAICYSILKKKKTVV